MIKVLFASEQPLLNAGLEAVLGRCPECEARNAPLAKEEWEVTAGQWQPDVALLEWPVSTNWNPLEVLRQAAPGCRSLLLLKSLSPEAMFQAREAGAAGAVSVQATPAELIEAMQRVQAGEFVFDHGIEWPHGTRRVRLTRRESDLVCLLVQGLKNKEIAATLGLTEGTVKVYLCKLFQKVGAKDRFELALFGLRNLSFQGDGPGAALAAETKPGRLRTLVISPQQEGRARLTA
jgi:DNA-binding NarL/FixJ family response regulator